MQHDLMSIEILFSSVHADDDKIRKTATISQHDFMWTKLPKLHLLQRRNLNYKQIHTLPSLLHLLLSEILIHIQICATLQRLKSQKIPEYVTSREFDKHKSGLRSLEIWDSNVQRLKNLPAETLQDTKTLL